MDAKTETSAAYEPGVEDRFGLCPDCAAAGKYADTFPYLNVHKNLFKLCEEHKVYWPMGYGLFSSWEQETEEDWTRNKAKLDTMRRVEPAFLPATEAAWKDREHREWQVRALFRDLDRGKQDAVLKLLCEMAEVDFTEHGIKYRTLDGGHLGPTVGDVMGWNDPS